MREACQTATTWPLHTRVAVNVSGVELLENGFLEQVKEILVATELQAHRLCIEVTETTLGADQKSAISALTRLKALGIVIAIDDFGVGYSSLSRLDRLPVDVLKVDRSFIAEIPPTGGNPLVAAIATLASAVGLHTIAEGVEHDYQADALQRFGFACAQGFLFAKPAGPEQLAFAAMPVIPAPRAHSGETSTAALAPPDRSTAALPI